MNIGKQHDILLDCGAYNGDTAMAFINRIKTTHYDYEKIYCIEADEDNFNQLTKIKTSYPNIECILKGVWNRKDILRFNRLGSNSSSVQMNGDIQVEVDTIDNILNGKPVTIIKMDIEGSELNALSGAECTILKYRPKLAICVYHKKADIFKIFEYISKLHNYKFYLRAHAPHAFELVLYAV